jgi:hypothetical protein
LRAQQAPAIREKARKDLDTIAYLLPGAWTDAMSAMAEIAKESCRAGEVTVGNVGSALASHVKHCEQQVATYFRNVMNETLVAYMTEAAIRRHAGPAASIPLDGRKLMAALKNYAATGEDVVFRYADDASPIALECGSAKYVQAPHTLRSTARTGS